MFVKKFSSDNEHAKADLSTVYKLHVQTCAGSVCTVSWICTKAKMSFPQKSLPERDMILKSGLQI